MENIYIKVEEIPRNLVQQYFNNKDLISIDELIKTLDDVNWELNYIKDEYEEYKTDIEENYKFIDTREAIGYDERTW